jgi:hypothetical protein
MDLSEILAVRFMAGLPLRHADRAIAACWRRTKAAAKYLAATGAVRSASSGATLASIVPGKTTSGTIKARWWIHAQNATRVAALARRFAGADADAAEAGDAVQRSAAASLRATR